MSNYLDKTSISTDEISLNKINEHKGGVVVDDSFPYSVNFGFHAGSIDHTKWKITLNAYDGVGLNPIGLYGVSNTSGIGTPKFLLAAKNAANNSDWGQIYSGEFRVGDNVKESSGTLIGENWMRFTPEDGFIVQGPLLQNISSSENLILSPNFDSQVEFTPSGGFTYNSTGGYNGGSCYNISTDGSLEVFGSKRLSGATIIRGSVHTQSDASFDGDLSVVIESFDVDGNSLGTSNTIISVYPTTNYQKYDYALRIDNSFTDTFTIKLVVGNMTTGSLMVDNWTAYRVFQTAINTTTLPEIIANPDKGVVVDINGVRAYWNSENTFNLSASDGSAYFKGNVRVGGYVHTGPQGYDETNLDGCGLNQYGIYGANEGTPKFLVTAEAFGATDFWGDAVNAGELRVGNDVSKNGSDLAATSYLWFDGTDVKIKGTITATSGTLSGDLNITSGGAVIAGSESGDWSALNYNGFAAGTGGNYTVLISNTAMAVSTPTVAGEVRFGENVGSLSGDYFRYLPEEGIYISCNGVVTTPTTTTIGGTDSVVLDDLTINGDLVIDSGTLYATNSSNFTGLNYNGLVGYSSSYGYTFIIANGTGTGWTDEVEAGEVRFGANLDNLNLSAGYLRFRPSSGLGAGLLEVKGTINATDGYFTDSFRVGDGTNYIEIEEGGNAPYIQSKIQTGGETGAGWKLEHDGTAYLNKIEGINNWLRIEEYVINITSPNAIDINSSGGTRILAGGSQLWLYGDAANYIDINGSSNTINIHPHVGGSVTIGYSATSGTVGLYGNEIGLSGNAVYICSGGSSQYLSFFANRSSQKRTGVTDITSLIAALEAYGLIN